VGVALLFLPPVSWMMAPVACNEFSIARTRAVIPSVTNLQIKINVFMFTLYNFKVVNGV